MRSGTDKPDNLESLLIIIIRLNRLTQAKERLEKQEGKVLTLRGNLGAQLGPLLWNGAKGSKLT